MKFKEEFYEDDVLGVGPIDDIDLEDTLADENIEMAEVEVILDEPTRMVDVDGSVILAEPGDVITIKSESIKRIKQ